MKKFIYYTGSNKRGLGTAYIDGFNWGLSNNYEYIVEMDADLSHRTEDLKKMIEVCQDCDLVIGSRYTSDGNTEGWSLFRGAFIKKMLISFLG